MNFHRINQKCHFTKIPESIRIDTVSPSEVNQSEQFSDSQASDKQNLPVKLTGIQLLNDDCLLAIFSVKKELDLMDLCSLAETCTRFRTVAGSAIQNKVSIQTKNGVDYEVMCGNYMHKTSDRIDIVRIFENLGASLSSLFASSCGSYSNNCFVLDLTTKHCTDNLKDLRIVNLSISPVITKRLEPIFKRLQLLHLDRVSIMGDKTLFENCDALVELNVVHVENDNVILENVFPKLKRFTYNTMADSIPHPVQEYSLNVLLSFIASHSTLKSFNLHVSFCDDSFKITIPQIIANSCTELTDLKISIGKTTVASLQPLETLKSLQCLKSSLLAFDDFHFISCLPKLRELRLEWCDLPDDINQFASLTELTKLELIRCTTPDVFDIFGIISRLIKLEEWTISGLLNRSNKSYFALDEETFSTIVSTAISRRMKVLTLKCDFEFDWENFDEHQKVRLLSPID